MGVDLGCLEGLVSQEVSEGEQVACLVVEDRRERVSQLVRADLLRESCFACDAIDHISQGPDARSLTEARQEQRRLLVGPAVQVLLDRNRSFEAKRHHSFLVALAVSHEDLEFLQVDVAPIEPLELGDSESSEDGYSDESSIPEGSIRDATRGRLSGGLKQEISFSLSEEDREPTCRLLPSTRTYAVCHGQALQNR